MGMMGMRIGLRGKDAPTQTTMTMTTTDLWSRHMCFCGFLIARSMDRRSLPKLRLHLHLYASDTASASVSVSATASASPQLNTPYIVCAIEIPLP